MNALARTAARPAAPLDVLLVRSQVRAFLVASGDLDLHEAIDGLQTYAIDSGLVGVLGQDGVQQLLSDAFAVVAP